MGQIKNFKVELNKLEYLYENTPSAIIGILVLSLVIFFAFKGHTDQTSLDIWLALNIFLSVLRTASLFYYKRTTITLHNLAFFKSIIFIFIVLSGLLWGVGAFYILPSGIEYQILLLLMVGGLCAGSSVSNASNIGMFYTYIAVVIPPYFYIFLVGESQISGSVLIALVLYITLLLFIARKITANVNKNIMLAYENRELVEQLERKVIEANKANDAKSEFLSVMSHEIRTPLNAIIGFVKILKNSENDPKKLHYLDTVDKSSLLLMNVINDILDVSKIESGKFTLEYTRFDPTQEIASLYELFKRAGEEKGVTLHNKISEHLPKCIQSDKLRLKQIISNLLSNAIKFTPKGKGVTLYVDFNIEKSSLVIEVKDEGIGIEANNIDNILQEFTQADSSIAREYGGTGLGLSIVTKLLKLFGSQLHITSEISKGSTFSFEIKVEVFSTIKYEEPEDTEVHFDAQKILVAEDNKTNQMLIELLLEDMNLEVVMANDGVEALELFDKEEFSLILMDINMPNKNGIEAMQEIRHKKSTVPVIALTANAVAGDKQRYLEQGFDDYVAKPIKNEILARVLQKYLG